ncbi:MAG: DUF3526 domain-containing protein [Gemmatimonadaceae bacterium]|nr:DUF3526 domain-containing protein [Gemmatimonadaceae bacterium]
MRHEWRLLTGDRFGLTATLLFAALLAFASLSGMARHAREQRTIDTVEREYRTRVDSVRARFAALATDTTPPASPFAPDPRMPGAVGNTLAAPWATLPPGPLFALATGQSDLVRPYVKITTQSRQTVVQLEQLDNPLNLLDGGFDLSIAILLLLPLVVIAVGYGLLAEEREQGTLALVMSQPVSVTRVVLAKLIVRGGVVWAATMIAMLGTALISGALAAPLGGVALAIWVGVVTLWIAIWLALCLWVNAGQRSSAANALRLVAIWLALVVVAPALVNAAAQWRHPAPSRVELIGRMREASNAANARGTELLKQFYGDHPELAPPGSVDLQDFAARRLVVQADVDRTLAPLLDGFGAQLAAQQRVVQRWQWVSPAIAVHTVLLDAAGTGASRYRAFEEAITRFHAAWLSFFADRIYAKRRMTTADYAALPAWQWSEASAGALGRTVAPSVAILALVTVGVMLAAVRAVRRVTPVG